MKKLLLVTVLLCLVSQFAYADDYYPAPWRGLPGTTFQQWEFGDPDPNPLPNLLNNPYGMPSTVVIPKTGMGWFQEYNGRFGVWPLSGYIETTIPNTPIPNPEKIIWLSLTWIPQGVGCTPFVIETTTATSGEVIYETAAGAGWMHTTYKIVMEPNPVFETILIQGDVMVDEMVVDTVCIVPEPGSLAVLGTGVIGLLLGLRRRR